MRIKELIKELQKFNQEAEILLSSDEEINMIYKGINMGYYENKTRVVLWGTFGIDVQ